jgi:hypothetical protein
MDPQKPPDPKESSRRASHRHSPSDMNVTRAEFNDIWRAVRANRDAIQILQGVLKHKGLMPN